MPKIPKFKSEEEEVNFWDKHSATEFIDELEEVKGPLFVRPAIRAASVRFQEGTLKKLKSIARDKGLNYTTLIRMWVMEKLKQEQPVRSPR